MIALPYSVRVPGTPPLNIAIMSWRDQRHPEARHGVVRPQLAQRCAVVQQFHFVQVGIHRNLLHGISGAAARALRPFMRGDV